jgi:predicted DCC family thiol-disulfide oxidoreductase YuxK
VTEGVRVRPVARRVVCDPDGAWQAIAKGDHFVSQSHFTLRFPLKAQADTHALTDELTPLMSVLFEAAETIGTIHYARITVLSERTLLFLGDFDGEFTLLMSALAKLAGPVFDAIFRHVAKHRRRSTRSRGSPRCRSRSSHRETAK